MDIAGVVARTAAVSTETAVASTQRRSCRRSRRRSIANNAAIPIPRSIREEEDHLRKAIEESRLECNRSLTISTTGGNDDDYTLGSHNSTDGLQPDIRQFNRKQKYAGTSNNFESFLDDDYDYDDDNDDIDDDVGSQDENCNGNSPAKKKSRLLTVPFPPSVTTIIPARQQILEYNDKESSDDDDEDDFDIALRSLMQRNASGRKCSPTLVNFQDSKPPAKRVKNVRDFFGGVDSSATEKSHAARRTGVVNDVDSSASEKSRTKQAHAVNPSTLDSSSPGGNAALPTPVANPSVPSPSCYTTHDNLLHIPRPPDWVLLVSSQWVPQELRDICKEWCSLAYQLLLEAGFVYNARGVFNSEFLDEYLQAREELSSTLGVIYEVWNQNGEKRKVGMTRNAKQRDELAREKGTLKPDDTMIETINLDLLTQSIDSKLQEYYRSMVAAIKEHQACPREFRNLLHAYTDRGGEALGVKGISIRLMVEFGKQLHIDSQSPAPFEWLWLPPFEHQRQHVNQVLHVLKSHIQDFFGKNVTIDVLVTASWDTGADKVLKDGVTPRLETTPCALANIMGKPVDMSKVDTVPYHPYAGSKDPSHRKLKYSSQVFEKNDLDLGLDNFWNKIDNLKPYQMLVCDTNSFLFNGNRKGALKGLRERGFIVRVEVWDYELSWIVNTEKMTAILLDAPFGDTGNADLENFVPNTVLTVTSVLLLVYE